MKACVINLGLKRAVVDSGQRFFEEKSKFLWTYHIHKIYTDMHGKAAGISNKNGLELHRLIYQLTGLSVEWVLKI